MYRKCIKELEKKLKYLKAKEASYNREQSKVLNRNNYMKALADNFRQELLNRMTNAEVYFQRTALKLKIHLESQYIIYIKKGKEIQKFFIADFCDTKRKIIFEIDGKYHNNPTQIISDQERTSILQKEGYIIYRLTNKEVYQGKTLKLLKSIYN